MVAGRKEDSGETVVLNRNPESCLCKKKKKDLCQNIRRRKKGGREGREEGERKGERPLGG